MTVQEELTPCLWIFFEKMIHYSPEKRNFLLLHNEKTHHYHRIKFAI